MRELAVWGARTLGPTSFPPLARERGARGRWRRARGRAATRV